LLTPSDYGIYALLGAFQSFCGLLLVNPVGQHLNRHTHAWWDDGTLLQRLVRYNRYIVGVSFFISLPVMVWWLQSQTTSSNNCLLFAVAAGAAVASIVYLGTWNLTLIPMLNLLGFRARSASWTIATTVFSLAFSFLLVMQYHSAVAWMFGQAAGAAIGAWFAWFFLRRYHADHNPAHYQSDVPVFLLDKQTIKTFCLPLAVATGFMWLQNAGYRFVVGGVWGAEELGILVVGLGISAQLWAIIDSLAMQFLGPYLYRHFTEAKSDVQSGMILSDFVNVLAPVYAMFAGFNVLCAATILNVLTNERYHIAAPFVVFGTMVEFARCITNLWSNAAQAKRQTKGVILPYVLGAVTVWGGALGVINFGNGINAFAMVLIGGGIVTCASMIIIMQRLLPVRIDAYRWLAGFVVLGISFTLAAIIPISDKGVYQNLGMLLLCGGLICACMAAMLWRNPALNRLLVVQLRKE